MLRKIAASLRPVAPADPTGDVFVTYAGEDRTHGAWARVRRAHAAGLPATVDDVADLVGVAGVIACGTGWPRP